MRPEDILLVIGYWYTGPGYTKGKVPLHHHILPGIQKESTPSCPFSIANYLMLVALVMSASTSMGIVQLAEPNSWSGDRLTTNTSRIRIL